MLSATADTNIYISALNFGGPPLRFLDMACAGAIRVDISKPILEEVLRVLCDKFRWEADKIQEAEALITGFTQRVTPTKTLDVIKEDPPDDRVLECAAEAPSDFIVTGDRDLLRLGHYDTIPIVKVADFLNIALRPPASPQR
jgi:putative PIN family toxin of toxin-antitoxin system